MAVKLDGKHIGDIAQMSIDEAENWFNELHNSLTTKQNQIARRILREINERLGFLKNVACWKLTAEPETNVGLEEKLNSLLGTLQK